MLLAWGVIGLIVVAGVALLFGRHKVASVRPKRVAHTERSGPVVLRKLDQLEQDSLAGNAASIATREAEQARLSAKDPRHRVLANDLARLRELIRRGTEGADPDTIPESVMPYIQL